MKRALVTGATGMLGACIVERLAAAGWSVRALVRDHVRSAWIESLGGQRVPGDLADPASLRAAARGCDAIFHAAAAIGAGSGSAFQRDNVTGTAHVVAAAETAGSRLVHVSSTSVFGRRRYYATATDESVALPVLPDADAYGRSKQEAERLVLAAHAAGRVWASVVRPPLMYGKRDRQLLPRLGPVLEWGLFPLVDGGTTTLTLVHADSVAEGAIRAVATPEAAGRVYHLTNDFDVTAADVVRYAEVGLGHRLRAPTVSGRTARLAFRALAAGLVLAGRRDLARHAQGVLDMLTRDNPFSSERARRELGWSPVVRPADGLPEAVRWWRERRLEVSGVATELGERVPRGNGSCGS